MVAPRPKNLVMYTSVKMHFLLNTFSDCYDVKMAYNRP